MLFSQMLIGCAGTIVNNKFWICSDVVGVLICLNLDNWRVEKAYAIPKTIECQQATACCLYHEGNLYMIPHNMQYLFKFNISDEKFETIDIVKDEMKNRKSKYGRAFIYNQTLYMFGHQGTEELLIYNLQEGKIINSQGHHGFSTTNQYEWINNLGTFVIDGDYAYSNIMGFGAYLIIDLKTHKVDIHYLNDSEFEKGVVALGAFNGKQYASTRSGELYEFDLRTGKKGSILISGRDGGYEHIIDVGKKMICIPLNQAIVDIFDISGEITTVELDYKNWKILSWLFRCYGIYQNNLIVQSGFNGMMYSINLNTNRSSMHKMIIDKDLQGDESILPVNFVINENDVDTVEAFINQLI